MRIGNAVHRTTGPWAAAVHTLLADLRAAGIDQVPEPRGFDAEGREVLGFLPGQVAHYPLPDWLWSEQVLTDTAVLLRRIHDGAAHLVEADLPWQQPLREPAEVICHNDVAPYNMVFDDGRLVGLIDFDTASPGPRLWDLAYLGYRIAPLVSDAGEHAPADWAGRLRTLLAAYGSQDSVADLLTMMGHRLEHIAEHAEAAAVRTGRTDLAEHAAMYRRDRVRVTSLASALAELSP